MAKKKKEVTNSLPACVQNTNQVDFSKKEGASASVDFLNGRTIENVRDSHALCNEYAPELIKSCIADLKGHSMFIDMAKWPVMKEILDRGLGRVAQGVFVEKKQEMELLESTDARWLFLEGKADEFMRLLYEKGILQKYIKKLDKEKGLTSG
jgi:hypothetical protein